MNKLLKSIELRKQQLYKTDKKPLSNIENKSYLVTYLVDNILLSSSEDEKTVPKAVPVQEKLTNEQITELIFDGIIRGENKFTLYFEDNTFIQQKHSSKHNLLLLYQRCNQYYGTTKIPVRVEDGWIENPNSIFSNSKITENLTAETPAIKCIKKSDLILPEGMTFTNEDGFLTGLDAKYGITKI